MSRSGKVLSMGSAIPLGPNQLCVPSLNVVGLWTYFSLFRVPASWSRTRSFAPTVGVSRPRQDCVRSLYNNSRGDLFRQRKQTSVSSELRSDWASASYAARMLALNRLRRGCVAL